MSISVSYLQAQNQADQVGHDLAYGALKSYVDQEFGGAVTMQRVPSAEEGAQADVLAISSLSQNWDLATRIAEESKIQNQELVTVAGGQHVTVASWSLTDAFDHAVLGEGEVAFARLLRSLLDGKKPERLLHAEPVLDLDVLPHPVLESGTAYSFTSRGCPYRCRFCSSSRFWTKVRFHSAEWVVDDIQRLMALGQQRIWIADDLFVAHRPRLRQIAELLDERGLKPQLDYCVRANLVDDELCELMRRIGTMNVSMGTESGSENVLRIAGKGYSVATNQRAIDVLAANGIPFGCFFIVGWPGETEADVHATYRFIDANTKAGKLKSWMMFVLSPWPGTPIWDAAVAAGQIQPTTFDWNRIGLTSPLPSTRYRTIDSWSEERRQRNTLYIGSVLQQRIYELMKQYQPWLA